MFDSLPSIISSEHTGVVALVGNMTRQQVVRLAKGGPIPHGMDIVSLSRLFGIDLATFDFIVTQHVRTQALAA
jgi:hypothetical protein